MAEPSLLLYTWKKGLNLLSPLYYSVVMLFASIKMELHSRTEVQTQL